MSLCSKKFIKRPYPLNVSYRSTGKYDVINIVLKRRYATRIWKENKPLYIKTAVERPILKLGLPNVRWSFYFILLFVASLLFRRFL